MNTMLSQTTGLTTKKSTRQSCRRCSGHMVHDMCIDLDSDCGYSTFWAHRCIQCGDMIDEVILRNRSLSNPEAVSAAAA
jgi:hypothetical protein